MADIITPILNIISVLCSCSSNNRCCYLLGLQENKDVLHTAMEELKATRDDVKIKVDEAENNLNERMKRTEVVDNWLQRAQNIEDKVSEILTKVDQEIEGRCFGGNFPINCWSAHKIGKLVNQELDIVKDHKSKGSFGDVAYRLPHSFGQREHVDSIVGMDSMFDKVWRLLAEDDVRIMGLYGKGGVGKTTLLKQINNEFLKTITTITTTTTTTTTSTRSNNNNTTTTTNNNLHGFDVVILVVVSQVINIDVIQKKIGDRLGLSTPNKENIFNALIRKNFVLLLDDLWEMVDLQSIGIPPRLKNKKSKIILTTRSEVVCGLMEANEMFKVEGLPWNEAWSLFQEKVGERALNSFSRAPELAKNVAKKCGGLPLALITIGRAMAAKKTLQEWKDAITTLQKYASKFPGMDKEVLPLLKLSYDNLSDDMIKSCFLYCALFPEDCSIKKSKLIDYWIGEGFISLSEFDHIDEARNKGYGVIGDLKGASLLESGGNEETQVKMHDTIRDLALWIAHDCGNKRDKMFTIVSDLTTPERSSWYNKAERIYLIPSGDGETKEEGSPPPPLNSPNLITLIDHLRDLPQNFFEFTPLLRVLDLSRSYMETFPISITELVELRYLSLSWTFIKELPDGLGKLVKLNYLDLSHMWFLKKIPSGVIRSLVELRVLNLFETRRVDWDIEQVYKLKHLNDLGITINTEHNQNKLLSNKNLQMCTRHLFLERTPEANMGIEQQQLGSSCFQNLFQIKIRNCNGLKDLTWVGYVPNLQKLYVSYCGELEIIVVDDDDDLGGSKGGGNEIIFKSLKTLSLWELRKLKSICRNALAFPCLEEMVVVHCPQLMKLSFDSGSNVNNTLQKIQGEEEWWNELEWEEEDHNNNNNNNELVKSKFIPYFFEGSTNE